MSNGIFQETSMLEKDSLSIFSQSGLSKRNFCGGFIGTDDKDETFKNILGRKKATSLSYLQHRQHPRIHPLHQLQSLLLHAE